MAAAQSIADRYRVLRRLGSGGGGRVVLAQDTLLERPVAIKILHPEGPEEAVHRFRREARIGASMSHPNLVDVYDALLDGPEVMLVMEYVPGRSLAEALAGDERPSRAESLRVLRDVAAALDYVHDRGVLHRDVKPGNILLGSDGQAHLADLGVATAAETTRITFTGGLVGTAAYLAPELLEGGQPTVASDVFGLAAVAFEMLTGRRARRGRTALEIIRHASREGPPDAREFAPHIPAAARDALCRGMATRPEDRPASAGEFVRALEGALGREAVQERPAPVPVPVVERTAPAPERAAPPVAKRPTPPVAKPPAPPVANRPAPPAANRPAPPVERPAPSARRRRRTLLPLALLAATAAAVAAIVLFSDPGGEEGQSAGSATTPRTTASHPTRTTKTPKTPKSHARGPGAGTATGGAGTATGGSTSAPPSTSSATATTPDGVVRLFYERAAANRFADAWAVASPQLRGAWHNSLSAFSADLGSLQSIAFDRLQVTSNDGTNASVAVATRARHTTYTDVCSGTIPAVRGSGGWLMGLPGVSCHHAQ